MWMRDYQAVLDPSEGVHLICIFVESRGVCMQAGGLR